jgi:hypothetical protein
MSPAFFVSRTRLALYRGICGASGCDILKWLVIPRHPRAVDQEAHGHSRAKRKVVLAVQGGFWGLGCRPRSARRRGGLFLIFRMVAAIFVWPAWRIRPITRLRSVAMILGRDPVLTGEASSRNVTSRTLLCTRNDHALWGFVTGHPRAWSLLSVLVASCRRRSVCRFLSAMWRRLS